MTKYVTWSDKPLKASDTDFQITFPYAMYQNRENSDTLEMEYGLSLIHIWHRLESSRYRRNRPI